ncbi:MAG: phytoene desaturase family protein [Pleurocapsa sp.]
MSNLNTVNKYDAIVIGSGIGGLTTAAILSKYNRKKVLILEQHYVIGGFTHEFERRGFHWDVGLHYVGDMGEGEIGRQIFDYITEGKLHWNKMPDPFEKFVYPDFTFEVYSDPQQYQSDLTRMFPTEKVAIKKYFAHIKQANLWHGLQAIADSLPGWLRLIVKLLVKNFGKIIRLTTQEYLDRSLQNPQLKSLLVSQWGTYALPPSQSSFGIHALLVNHYLNGAWYPIGGAKEIAKNILPVIKKAGGKAIARRKVTEILIENGVAMGVRAKKTHKPEAEIEEYYAPVIISDAGAFNTYTKLVPASYSIPHREEIRTFPKAMGNITLYLGFTESPIKLGFQGENHWIYQDYDHDRTFKQLSSLEEFPTHCYLSFPSLKNPLASNHTGEIISFIDYQLFSQWQDQPWQTRGEDYLQLKAKLSKSLIELVESKYPGFRDLIAYSELSTPLTVEYFDASDRGAIYGIPATTQRLDAEWIGAKTPIKNLYLTGTDTSGHGILGAAIGGIVTAGILNGSFGFFKIMSALKK